MTTAEAREQLKNHGLTDDQATGVVDVLELWEKDRVVTRDYFDKRLAELKEELKAGSPPCYWPRRSSCWAACTLF